MSDAWLFCEVTVTDKDHAAWWKAALEYGYCGTTPHSDYDFPVGTVPTDAELDRVLQECALSHFTRYSTHEMGTGGFGHIQFCEPDDIEHMRPDILADLVHLYLQAFRLNHFVRLEWIDTVDCQSAGAVFITKDRITEMSLEKLADAYAETMPLPYRS
jgi:hypothetical protein